MNCATFSQLKGMIFSKLSSWTGLEYFARKQKCENEYQQITSNRLVTIANKDTSSKMHEKIILKTNGLPAP